MKWNYKELLESFEKECTFDEIDEVYKALLLLELEVPCELITPQIEKDLEETIQWYRDNDTITNLLDKEVIDKLDSYDSISEIIH